VKTINISLPENCSALKAGAKVDIPFHPAKYFMKFFWKKLKKKKLPLITSQLQELEKY